jgi:hypothetical protein
MLTHKHVSLRAGHEGRYRILEFMGLVQDAPIPEPHSVVFLLSPWMGFGTLEMFVTGASTAIQNGREPRYDPVLERNSIVSRLRC